MGTSTDTSISFVTGGAGYTFNGAEVEFVTGYAHLKSTFGEGTSSIVCPSVSRTGWGPIYKIEATITEDVGADDSVGYFLFQCSFDGGLNYKVHRSSGWDDVGTADFGMTYTKFASIRDWPETSTIIIKVVCAQTDPAALGTPNADAQIDQITITYLSTTSDPPELETVSTEPAASGTTLSTTLDSPTTNLYMPDYPISLDYLEHSYGYRTDMGYELEVSKVQGARRSTTMRWDNRDATIKDVIEAFIIAHYGNASFAWTPPGEASSAQWTFTGRYDIKRVYDDGTDELWTIETQAVEVFP